jgi:hypothetical protein
MGPHASGPGARRCRGREASRATPGRWGQQPRRGRNRPAVGPGRYGRRAVDSQQCSFKVPIVLRSGDSPTRFKEHAHRRLAAGGRSRCVQAVGATRPPRPLPRAVGKRRGFLHGYCSTIRRARQIDMPHLIRGGEPHRSLLYLASLSTSPVVPVHGEALPVGAGALWILRLWSGCLLTLSLPLLGLSLVALHIVVRPAPSISDALRILTQISQKYLIAIS